MKIMRYQTRLESEDDWELVVLNLVRRPSGIVEVYALSGMGVEGRERERERERVIYTLRKHVIGPSQR